MLAFKEKVNKIVKTIPKGKTMTYYGRWTYKFEEAARQGAKGCLIIHNTAAAAYPFAAAVSADSL